MSKTNSLADLQAADQGMQFPEEEPNFEIEVSDFQYVTRGIKQGKALRFTVTWKFRHPLHGLLGYSEEGWLMTRDYANRLKVSPPIHRFGPTSTKQLKTITTDFHNLLVAMIVNHRTKTGKSWADGVGLAPELRPELPPDFDEFPQEIKA